MRSSSLSKRFIKVILIIVWLFGIVAAYFWAHKPFGSEILAGLGRVLWNVLVWLGITWLGAGLGRCVVGGLLDKERAITRLALSAGLGLGLISLLILGLGLAGLLRPVIAWALVLVLGLAVWPGLHLSLNDLKVIRLPQPEDGFHRWLSVYGGISLLLTFLIALAPPTGWDTLVYHLTGPRFFVEAGRIVHPVDLPYLGFPQLAEMQFTLGLLLMGERVGPLLHFGYGLMALVVTVSLARRAFGRRAAWLSAALLLSVPTLFSLMTRAYVDAILLFYATAALYVFLRWRKEHEQGRSTSSSSWLVVMGLLCGFCGWVKYTAVLIPFALGLSLIWVLRHDGLGTVAKDLGLVAVVTAVVVMPGLLENMITAGNPVYPFFSSQGVFWDGWRSWWYDRPGTGLAATAPWRLLTAPIEATVLGTEGTVLYEATIGPLLLPSVFLLIFVWHGFDREQRSVVGYLMLFFGVNYVLWLNGLARTAMLLRSRFLFLTFGAVAALGGAALSRVRILNHPRLAVDWLVRAVMVLTLVLLLFSMVTEFTEVNPVPVIIGVESPDSYLTRRLGWYYPVIEHLNEQLPQDSTVLFLWEPRTYHCELDCRPDALLDRWLHAMHLYGHDIDALADTWRKEGITHVLLHRAGLDHILKRGFDPVTSEDIEALNAFRAEHLTLEKKFDAAYELYVLEARSEG